MLRGFTSRGVGCVGLLGMGIGFFWGFRVFTSRVLCAGGLAHGTRGCRV